jgi:DNA/RNA-binding protein KIN17
VRQMLLIGEDPRKHISDYSNQFQRDFLQLLRTAHGEKKVHINHFYQEYISNKEHVHMNATRWPSLTEFAKHLGREGICRVEDNEKGLHVSWIDNSPEALRRQDAIRKKERQDKGDEEREQRLIKEQIEKAELDAEEKFKDSDDEEMRVLQRKEGEKITLNFSIKPKDDSGGVSIPAPNEPEGAQEEVEGDGSCSTPPPIPNTTTTPAEKVSLKMGASNKPKNVFSGASKKNALGTAQTKSKELPKKPMTQAEKIMKEEIERKRVREANGFAGGQSKRQKVV